MKVEQENFFLAIFASVQRRRRRSGTSRVMARAKSALTTQRVGSVERRRRCGRPTARRPSKRISRTGSSVRISTPSSRATRAMASVSAPQPPMGWKTPYSYSRKERMENRLGHWNGDMPRYFDWNENASRMRGSVK